jgi:hypothetical protein
MPFFLLQCRAWAQTKIETKTSLKRSQTNTFSCCLYIRVTCGANQAEIKKDTSANSAVLVLLVLLYSITSTSGTSTSGTSESSKVVQYQYWYYLVLVLAGTVVLGGSGTSSSSNTGSTCTGINIK